MSSFIRRTKHPETGKWEDAFWLDDFYGPREYGVKFKSDGRVFRSERIETNGDKTNSKPEDFLTSDESLEARDE